MNFLTGFVVGLVMVCSCNAAMIGELSTQKQAGPTEPVKLLIAIENYKSGKVDAAREDLLEVLKNAPSNKKALYYLRLVDQVKTAKPAKATSPLDPLWKAPQPMPRYLI